MDACTHLVPSGKVFVRFSTRKEPGCSRIRKTLQRRRCLSCGTTEGMARRRYCSVDCRQKLRQQLEMRTGLIQALNARFAAFHFSDDLVILDIMISGSKEIFSFFYPRTAAGKPRDDFSRMADSLGRIWWAEKGRTNKHYLASRSVLDRAFRNHEDSCTVKPVELRIPSVKGAALSYLKLGAAQMSSPELPGLIKNAYRTQAKIHHPDLGGDPSTFRKIHQAYQELISWAEHPTYIRKRGFPDKWFYDADRNRWYQPTPLPR